MALLWAIATVVYVGTVQDWWVGAGSHVLIEIVHPLLGVGAIGLAEMLAAALNRNAHHLLAGPEIFFAISSAARFRSRSEFERGGF